MSKKAAIVRICVLILVQTLYCGAVEDNGNGVYRRDPGRGAGRPAEGNPVPRGGEGQLGGKVRVVEDSKKRIKAMGDELDTSNRRGNAQRASKPKPNGIATSEECASDAERICGHRDLKSNLEVLACMTNSRPTDEDLTPECHMYLWNVKLNITKDPKFHDVASQICAAVVEKFPDCNKHVDDVSGGKLIPCLLDHKDNIKVRPCYNFLVKMATIIYSDYQLICNFVEDCQDDINQYSCGRVNSGTKNDPDDLHSQGAVIECLETQLTDDKPLQDECAKQIVRLSELTSDDFHLDRNLFFKCRDDRERMCEEVVAGEGRVYKCLFKHKFDHEMSTECREAMTMRQKLVAHDYKASYDLHTFCSNDIKKHRCLEDSRYTADGTNDHNDVIGLSGVLLCLEDAMFTEQNKVKQDSESVVSEACRVRLDDFRRMLGEDYQLSPEIVKGCSREITDHCGDGVNKRGETIHCLMGLAQNKETRREGVLGHECEQAIMHLLKEDHAAADYRMDYALAQACNPVVITACGSYQEGDPMVLSCLMEHLNADVMKEDCRKRLLELQYFIGRDFYLDPKFFKKCHTDAARLCHIEGLKDKKEVTMPYSLVISCLYRHIPAHTSTKVDRKTQTSRECAEEVIEAMKQRALDMDLNPDLEEACRHALGEFCSDGNHDSGTEFQCLQDNISNITDANCVSKIEETTEIEEAEAGRIDDPLMAACEHDVEEFCEEELNSEDEGAVMDCLIESKPDLNEKCRAGITHLQILEMQDVKFSYSFMKSCKDDISRFCPQLTDGKHSKMELVHCLSGQHLDSQLDDRSEPVSEECASQLTIENLQRHENIELNPAVKRACSGDVKKLCPKVKKTGGAKGIECLREHKPKLSPQCRKQLFKLEEEEVEDRNLDYALMRSCKAPIKKYCYKHVESGDTSLILDCLVHNKEFLDQGCRDIVIQREMEEFSDINLNPQLKEACGQDITDKCSAEVKSQQTDENDGTDLQGRVIGCLKKKYTSKSKGDLLTQECARHIKFIMKEEQNDYRLDPMLTLRCVNAIKKYCDPKRGNVVECLKRSYFKGDLEKEHECTVEVARLLKEGRSDIMADPILHNLCSEDIQFHCREVAEGQGRIISCLLGVVNRGGRTGSLSPQCSEALKQRQEMWVHAKLDNFASFQDISGKIMESPHKSYFLTGITIFILCVLILGMLCGRVTKRVSRQRKML